MSDFIKDAAAAIREKRKAARLTQGQLAEKLGLLQQDISRIERGIPVTMLTAKKVLEALDIEVIYKSK